MVETPHLTIAHDDALVVDVLALACARNGIAVLAVAGDYDELLRQCAALRPHVALLAERIGDVAVDEALDQMAALDSHVIVLSDDPSPDRLAQLLARDIAGLLSHDAGPDDVVRAIFAVARGDMALNSSVLTVVLQQWRRLRAQPVQFGSRRRPVLTPRELDILAAMMDGLAAKAIAARLGVALKTVENHKIRVFEKLGVRSQAQAVTVAMAYGLTPPVGTSSQQSDFDGLRRP